MANIIRTGKDNIILPTLTNPALSENIELGYQAIDSDGIIIDGNMVRTEFTTGIVNPNARTMNVNCGFSPNYLVAYFIRDVTKGGAQAIFYCSTIENAAYYMDRNDIIQKASIAYEITDTGINITCTSVVSNIYFFIDCAYRYIAWK